MYPKAIGLSRNAMRFRLNREIITDEQKEFEEQAWYFVANFDPRSKDHQDGIPFMERSRKGFGGYKFGNAYDMSGKPLPRLQAIYVRP